MLLHLDNTSSSDLEKLLEYARKLNLNLRLLDQDENNPSLPGKPLSESALRTMIETSRKSGVISMESAHNSIRKNFNAD